MQRVSEYITRFLIDRGARDLFVISGAGNVRLLDAFRAAAPALRMICPHHEQAGVMASITYHRLSGRPAVMSCTGGPGACNTITGVASAWLDSIPAIVIAGQEKAEFLAPENRLRGKGVQGLDMVAMVRGITKYAACVRDPKEIRYHLERAFHEAYSGRPGPVWIDLPQDVQWARVDPAALAGFTPPPAAAAADGRSAPDYDAAARRTLELLAAAERPLLWAGHGIRLGGAVEEFHAVLERLGAPSLASWQAADLLDSGNPLYVGRAGTYGQRGANLALQNCDLLVCLGTRLALPQMGYVEKEFARAAKKVVVDIDPAEAAKLKERPEVLVEGDVKAFLRALLRATETGWRTLDRAAWIERCHAWTRRYPPCLPEYGELPPGKVNSYWFVDRLSDVLAPDDVIVTDMGTSLTCTHATIRLKRGQRLVTSTGLGEMGFGLPAAIGAALGSERRTVFIGVEGSLMMNIQELQTAVHLKLPIKAFILNNNGYLTIKHTERALFGESFSACTPESGVTFPDLEKVSRAFGWSYFKIDRSQGIEAPIRAALETPGPVFVEVPMPEDQLLGPKSGLKIRADGSLYSPPLEDLIPFIPRKELEEQMIIPLLPEG